MGVTHRGDERHHGSSKGADAEQGSSLSPNEGRSSTRIIWNNNELRNYVRMQHVLVGVRGTRAAR